MIGTDDMSSTSMDISESFRAEDLSKTDFFDFVSASEMGIGVGISNVGVGISLQAQHHQLYQDQHHQQLTQGDERLSNSIMTHDGGGTAARNCNSSDPTLPNYEFWNSDKDNSRLDSSIFEDLDRYCWQQQQQTTAISAQAHHPPPANQNANSKTHSDGSRSSGGGTINCDSTPVNTNATRTTHSVNSTGGSSGSISQINNSANTLSTTSVHNSDGQIYTITVLNGGNESATATATSTAPSASWLKREPDETQIPPSLDLDSLLDNFSGYIKSEYPYDDSGFSTDGTKEALNGDANSISIQQQQQQRQQQQQQQQQDTSNLNVMGNLCGGGGQTLPSLITAMSGGRACVNIGHQLAAQFQNNNNDWHMIDHNAEQNSAESLLRSALQGKGYTKGLHHMHNGNITLLPTSPSNKEDEMRRILFSNEADSLAFADSTLNASQIFEESQHQTNEMMQLHSNTSVTGAIPNGPMSQTAHGNNNSNLLVDDMFLTLENAFSDDFDKVKCIASDVQQYCNTPSVESDYISSDIMMQISPTAPAIGATTSHLQSQNSPVTTTPSSIVNIVPRTASPHTTGNATHHLQQHQHRKSEITPGTTPPAISNTPTTNNRISAAKPTKKYKRVSNSTSNAHNNNNNNNNNNSLSAINSNNNNNNNSNNNNNNINSINSTSTKSLNSNSSINNITPSSGGGGSSSSSSSSPPTAQCNGQRKERSLHYCSICSKGFKDKYSVNVHIRTHTGEKPFACSLCGKSFRQKAHLAKHYQTHMAQKNNHGTGIIKGNSSKHHRTSSAASGNSTSATQQQRQLSALTGSMPIQIGGNPGTGSGGGSLGLAMNPNLLGITSTVVTLNGPTNSVSLATNVLTPPNSLLTNR